MNVSIKELEILSQNVFTDLKDKGVELVEIQKDYYWSIPKENRYNLYEKPIEKLTLGQLSSDLENIRKISTDEQLALSYSLVWLASILRYVGEEIIR